MPVRKATIADQVSMAQVAARAFWDDELLGEQIHPYRNQFPDDMYLFWLSMIRRGWDSPFNHFLVSTCVAKENESEKIAAWTQWVRKGKGKSWKEPEVDLPPNRAVDPACEKILGQAYEFIQHEWTGQREECWDIAWLATDPDYQGQGHAKALLQFGINEATKEQVALSVISAWRKDGFYNKLGYTVPSGKFDNGENNPLRGRIRGGQIWWKEDHLKNAPSS